LDNTSVGLEIFEPTGTEPMILNQTGVEPCTFTNNEALKVTEMIVELLDHNFSQSFAGQKFQFQFSYAVLRSETIVFNTTLIRGYPDW
jgi:hypothetical protein